MIPEPIAMIQHHTERVLRKEGQPQGNCPHCQEHPDRFRLHDRRRRTFLVVIARAVYRALSLLSRWKCPLCRRTFTLYPPFALPWKRYVREFLFERGCNYLLRDELSYRRAIEVEGMPVFYDGPGEDGRIDERSLSHSTLHRWLSTIGALVETLRAALSLIRSKSATSDLFRRLFALAPSKYRSEDRKQSLDRALRLFETEAEYRALFARSIFPELATACAWS
jgi:hypothetical protein